MPITIDEFKKLPAERQAVAKVPNEELLVFLGEQAATTKSIEQASIEVKEIAEANRDKWIWLAGFFDGEGSIGFGHEVRGKHHFWKPAVRISQDNTSGILDEIRSFIKSFDVRCNIVNTGSSERVKSIMIWSANNVYAFLKKIASYLVIKHDVALDMIDYCGRRIAAHKKPYAKSDLQLIKHIYEHNQSNCKGYHAVVTRLAAEHFLV